MLLNVQIAHGVLCLTFPMQEGYYGLNPCMTNLMMQMVLQSLVHLISYSRQERIITGSASKNKIIQLCYDRNGKRTINLEPAYQCKY